MYVPVQITDALKPFAPKRLRACGRPRTVKEVVAHWKNKVRACVTVGSEWLVTEGRTQRGSLYLDYLYTPDPLLFVLQIGAADKFTRDDVQRLMALAQQYQVGGWVGGYLARSLAVGRLVCC